MLNRIVFLLFRVFIAFLNVCSWALILRAVLSWFMRPDMPIYAFLIRVTEPLIMPFRPLAYRLTNGRLPIDLAPLFSYFALLLLQRLIYFGMSFILL